MRKTSLLLLAFMAPAIAQGETDTMPIIVVANKSARPIADVVGSVVSISAADISKEQAENFDALLRYHPSLSMESTGNRFQSSSINIRGIGGNRVAIEVDGIPSSKQFDVGAFANSGRSLPEIDLISNIEILNGPASTLYGSDAIGGVVAIKTWDPAELTSQTEGDDFYKLRIGYDGKNHGKVASAMAAWQGDRVGSLISVTKRNAKEMNNDRFTTIEQDPLEFDSESIFSKTTFSINNDDLLTFTLRSSKHTLESDNNSMASASRRGSTEILGNDRTDATQLSLEYQFISDHPLFEDNTLRIYQLDSKTEQATADFRVSRGTPVRQDRVFKYKQKVRGVEFNSFGRVGRHGVVLGVEYNQTETEELRELQQTNLLTGDVTHNLLGEVSPLRDFPITKTEELGLFVQDEIALNASWTLVPALRFDYYHLEPHKDAIYTQSHPQYEVTSITETAWSPKLGVLHKLSDSVNVYAQYVRGFRAPPFEDANISLDIAMFRMRAIPNPDLKSETSDGFELGIRQIKETSRLEAAIFYTDYKDFIETKVNLGRDGTGTTLFQSQNLNKAEIYGAELSYKTDLGYWNKNLSAWDLDTKLSVTEGNNLENDQPLNSISPAQAIINLGWHTANDRWNINLITSITAAKTRVDETKADLYKTSGYTTFDLLANYQLTKNSELHMGVFNIGNKKYLRWQDVRNLDPADTLMQSVIQPERYVSLSVTTAW